MRQAMDKRRSSWQPRRFAAVCLFGDWTTGRSLWPQKCLYTSMDLDGY